MHDQTTTGPPGRPIRATESQPVAVLSAAVLIAARAAYSEDRADLAARAGLDVHAVDGVEEWYAPGLDNALSRVHGDRRGGGGPHPSWRELFETAAACDLLMTCLLDGDQAMATDVLADDDTRDTTVALLRWAITGDSRHCPACRAHSIGARRQAFGPAAGRRAADAASAAGGGTGPVELAGRVGRRRDPRDLRR